MTRHIYAIPVDTSNITEQTLDNYFSTLDKYSQHIIRLLVLHDKKITIEDKRNIISIINDRLGIKWLKNPNETTT